MFDHPFEQYLTYGASDQRTVRNLSGRFSGLMVPGTVAAFQREGTGGFVLTLSATRANTPYVIDPRFPLFQQPLAAPKKSHLELAKILGRPSLVSPQQPQPAAFTDEVIDEIARNWAAFNTGYQNSVGAKFDKYAKRLNEPVAPDNTKGPKYVLPPYTICEGVDDPWWEISKKFFDRTRHYLPEDHGNCIPVIAAKQARYLGNLLSDTRSDRVAIWVSGLDELRTQHTVLAEYATAIHDAHANRSTQLFAQYGGFFSVILSSVGLGGSCHGIGFGEHRDYLELPQSGPPPARYYLPSVHRYVLQDFAYQLWLADPELAKCDCKVCGGEPPIHLDYHELMEHSVECRSREVDGWVGLEPHEVVARLVASRKEFLSRLALADLPRVAEDDAFRSTEHLQRWIDALDSLT